jgi:hypothetical protein
MRERGNGEEAFAEVCVGEGGCNWRIGMDVKREIPRKGKGREIGVREVGLEVRSDGEEFGSECEFG